MSTPWQTNPPATAGHWEMRCDETEQEPQTVYVFDRGGELWVEDPHIGRNTLEHYRYNLCSIQWRKPPPAENPWQHKAEIYEHALRLIADDKANPEGWATDKQIADYYLQKASMP